LFQKRSLVVAFFALMALGVSYQAEAASGYDFSIGALAGVGGTEETDSYTEPAFEVLGAMELYPRTFFVVRYGQLSLDQDSGNLPEGDLSYLTVSTEYKYNAGFYNSGLFIGLGYYNLQSDDDTLDEGSFGFNLGVTGEIPITNHLGVLIELSGHYADLDATQILLMGHAGLIFHF
jgi:hypothetical protein